MKRTFLIGVAVLLQLAALGQANAASLYIDPPFSAISSGDAINLSVRLDTDEASQECVNAVDAVIKYPENIQLVDTSTGDSIFSMWVEQPKIDTTNRTLTFAGGIPNGYCGRIAGDPRLTNNIVTLVFRSPGFSVGQNVAATTSAIIEFSPETTAYLNDGLGTKAELALFGASIDIGKNPSQTLKDPWHEAVVTDDIAPEPFTIILHKDEKAFGGQYFIAFNTSDKQTGIDQYQIMEEPLSKFWSFEWGRATAPWVAARSPYTLEDQSLNSTIRVKAIDKAGNEYIATLIPEEAMRTVPLSQIILIAIAAFVALILFIVIVTFVVSVMKKKKIQKMKNEIENI